MNAHRRTLVRAVVTAAGVLATLGTLGYSDEPRPDQVTPGALEVHQATGDLSWPSPPAAARVRLSRTLRPGSAGGRRSVLRRLWTAVTGDRPVPTMSRPYGMTIDAMNRLYVVDSFSQTVHVFELRTGRYSSMHVEGDSLIGIASLGTELVITDSAAGKVRAIDAKGRSRWTVGAEAGLTRPTGIVAGGDRTYVVDTLAHQIVVLGAGGAVLDRFGSHGSEPGQFNYPTQIARDGEGRLYVTDAMNFRVQVLSAQGRFLRAFGKLGDGSGDFSKPKGIGVDSDGHIYVVDGYLDVIQVFDPDGRFLLPFGSPGVGPGQFWLATGLLVHDDRVYVTDATNGRVEVFEYLKQAP